MLRDPMSARLSARFRCTGRLRLRKGLLPVLFLGGFAALLAAPASCQTWERMADLPGAGRHHPVTFTVDGFGYAVTGTSPGIPTDDFYRYDPGANEWQVLPDFPGPDRSYSYGGAYGGKGYLGFGLGNAYFNDLWEYDPGTQAWTQLASCPGAGRTHPAFVITDDGKIYVGMGGAIGGNLRDWWVYDIASDEWTRLADLPGPARHHPYYFNIGDIPYVGFGHGAGIFKDVYRFDPAGNSWTRLADFPGEGRVAGTQFTHGGMGYILSGQGQDHNNLDTGEFWEFDPVNETWTQLMPPHPGSGRWAPASFLIGNNLYFLAGESNQGLQHDLWVYNLTRTSAVEPVLAETGPRIGIYPNPATGAFVSLRAPLRGQVSEKESILWLNADGRVISRHQGRPGNVPVPAGIASGRYFLSFALQDGSRQIQSVTILR